MHGTWLTFPFLFSSLHPNSRLAACELYVTLGSVLRNFPDLTIKPKTREELLYMDYFSSYHPEKYNKFYFELPSSKVEA